MANSNFEVGNEVMVRGAVTAVWPDGQVTHDAPSTVLAPAA